MTFSSALAVIIVARLRLAQCFPSQMKAISCNQQLRNVLTQDLTPSSLGLEFETLTLLCLKYFSNNFINVRHVL